MAYQPAAAFPPNHLPITPTHVAAFKRDGLVVVDGVFDSAIVAAVRSEMLARRAAFNPTMQASTIRSDTVSWITGEAKGTGPAVAGIIAALKGLAVHFEPVVQHTLYAPSKCMAAIYPPPAPAPASKPTTATSTTATTPTSLLPPPGVGYKVHLDNLAPEDEDMYWLWKSQREQSGRVLTSILYLNEWVTGYCFRYFRSSTSTCAISQAECIP
jgi:hypothetical protein